MLQQLSIIIGVCGLLFFGALSAQPENETSLIGRIAESYNRFEYAEADRLLTIALNAIDSYSTGDRVEIFRFAAFREFQKNMIPQARGYFWRLLELEPTLNLDPVTTSPKILTLFNTTRLEYLEQLQQKLAGKEDLFTAEKPWRSLVLPGWEQMHRGHRTRGLLWMSASAALFAGTVQSVIRTRSRYDRYLQATDPQESSTRYEAYNRLYQSQFYWGYGLAAVWLGAHIDAVFFTRNNKNRRLALSPNISHPGVQLTVRF